jgi:hypothetical protein
VPAASAKTCDRLDLDSIFVCFYNWSHFYICRHFYLVFALGRLVRLEPQIAELFVESESASTPSACHMISSINIGEMWHRVLWRVRRMSYLQSLKPWEELRDLFSKLKSRMQPVSNLNLFLHMVRNTVTIPFDLPWETDEWSRFLTMTKTSRTSCSLRLLIRQQVNEATGDLMQHDDSLEIDSFQADLFELEDNWPEAPEHPQDVVPSPSEAIVLPSSSAQHVELQSSNENFSNLLTHAMRDTAASSFVLPLETDEWSCMFNPDSDIMDTLLPSFEPKLKAVKLNHVDEKVDAVVAKGGSLKRI